MLSLLTFLRTVSESKWTETVPQEPAPSSWKSCCEESTVTLFDEIFVFNFGIRLVAFFLTISRSCA